MMLDGYFLSYLAHTWLDDCETFRKPFVYILQYVVVWLCNLTEIISAMFWIDSQWLYMILDHAIGIFGSKWLNYLMIQNSHCRPYLVNTRSYDLETFRKSSQRCFESILDGFTWFWIIQFWAKMTKIYGCSKTAIFDHIQRYFLVWQRKINFSENEVNWLWSYDH